MFGIFLTFLKPFNSAFIGWCLFHNYKLAAALGIGWLMLCDIFDGVFFRQSALAKSGEIPHLFKVIGIQDMSWFRSISDVVGDRIAVEFCQILMVVWYDYPIWLYAIELLKEFFLIGIWLYGKYWKSFTVRAPNPLSRLSMLSVGLMGMAWLLFPVSAPWFLIPVLGFGIPGAIQYYNLIIIGSK